MEPIKIHPFDVFRILNERTPKGSVVDLLKMGKEVETLPDNQLIIDGVLYEQTTEVPPSKEALEVIS
jgi:hypothetical protein